LTRARPRRRRAQKWPAHWFVVSTNVATFVCGWCGAAWQFWNLETDLELMLLAGWMLGLPKALAVLERKWQSSGAGSSSSTPSSPS